MSFKSHGAIIGGRTTSIEVVDEVPDIWLEFSHINHPPPSPPCSFPRFSSLPTELRLQIYEASLLPRIIAITCHHRTAPSAFHQPRLAAPQPPALLHVSREARHEVALKHYPTPLFGASISSIHAATPFRAPPRIWFDPHVDSVVLAGELEVRNLVGMAVPMAYFLPKGDCALVRRVALGFACLGLEEEGMSDEGLFVLLSHVVDRFPGCARLFITMTGADARLLRGRRGTMLWDRTGGGGNVAANSGAGIGGDVSGALQRLWDGWVSGCTVTGSRLRRTEIVLVDEGSLEKAWWGG